VRRRPQHDYHTIVGVFIGACVLCLLSEAVLALIDAIITELGRALGWD